MTCHVSFPHVFLSHSFSHSRSQILIYDHVILMHVVKVIKFVAVIIFFLLVPHEANHQMIHTICYNIVVSATLTLKVLVMTIDALGHF